MGNGNMKGSKPFHVTATRVACRAGNVDITRRHCDLTFGDRIAGLDRRAAHELYATLLEAGARSEGAAGTAYAVLEDLDCRIEPKIIADRAGGGAACSWEDE